MTHIYIYLRKRMREVKAGSRRGRGVVEKDAWRTALTRRCRKLDLIPPSCHLPRKAFVARPFPEHSPEAAYTLPHLSVPFQTFQLRKEQMPLAFKLLHSLLQT